jgi:CRP-like cAMP-binding protein
LISGVEIVDTFINKAPRPSATRWRERLPCCPPQTVRRPPALNRNRLLAALPSDEYARIAATLDTISLPLKQYLHKARERIDHVYFPGGGFCSMVTELATGDMIEIATIGRQGIVGASAMLRGDPVTTAVMVQGATDTCYPMPVDAFRREVGRSGQFAHVVSAYSHALFGFVAQSTACNALHSVEQRFARWLLMAHDRMERDEFPLTQEFAAMMLGATRPTVSVVAGTLQKAGLIQYRQGHVTILDRERLAEVSCECYGTVTMLLNAV